MSTPRRRAGNPAEVAVVTNAVTIDKAFFGFGKRRESNVEELGSMIDCFGLDFSIRPCDGSLRKFHKGLSKIITVEVILPDGDNKYFPLSKQVSELLANGDITIGHLLDFPLLRTDSTNRETGEITKEIWITVPTEGLARTEARSASEITRKDTFIVAQSYKAPAW